MARFTNITEAGPHKDVNAQLSGKLLAIKLTKLIKNKKQTWKFALTTASSLASPFCEFW